MDCPLCDGLGMIDHPLKPGRLKKCPECDTMASSFFLPLATLVGPPEDGGRDHFEAAEKRRLEAARAEDAAVAAHALTAPSDCACPWCTVQPPERHPIR